MRTAVARPDGFHLDREHTRLGDLLTSIVAAVPLIRILARKEFHVRYRRASFGVLWAVALPLTQALVLAAVLSRITRFETPIALPVFIFAGTLPFSYLTATVGAAATSIVENSQMSSRVYFPRAVLPLMVVLSNLYGLGFGLFSLAVLTVAFGETVGPELVLLVAAVGSAVLLATGIALVTSALHVYFRDVKYVVAATSTVWFYATPVFYPLDALDGTARGMLVANPATGMVQLFRASLGADVVSFAPAVLVTVGVSTAFIAVGLFLHARWDRVFADLL